MNYTQIKMWHLLCAAFLKANTNSQIPIYRIDVPHHQIVILSELQRVEESTQIGNCNTNIGCEDPSAPFHSAQDDKTEDSTNSIRRAGASDRIGRHPLALFDYRPTSHEIVRGHCPQKNGDTQTCVSPLSVLLHCKAFEGVEVKFPLDLLVVGRIF